LGSDEFRIRCWARHGAAKRLPYTPEQTPIQSAFIGPNKSVSDTAKPIQLFGFKQANARLRHDERALIERVYDGVQLFRQPGG
jgi:hypothetical protein